MGGYKDMKNEGRKQYFVIIWVKGVGQPGQFEIWQIDCSDGRKKKKNKKWKEK